MITAVEAVVCEEAATRSRAKANKYSKQGHLAVSSGELSAGSEFAQLAVSSTRRLAVKGSRDMNLVGQIGTADPLIAAFDNFRGAVIDLSSETVIDGDRLRLGRDASADSLGANPVVPGEPVILSVANGPGFFRALFTLLHIGAAPILVHSAAPAAELVATARRWGARRLLTDTVPEHIDVSSIALDTANTGPCIWSTIARAEPVPCPQLAAAPLHPTSGSTGEPKLTVRPAPCATAEAAHYIETLRIGADDVLLCTTPMSHAYAYGLGVVAPLLSHARVVTMSSLTPRQALRAVAEHGVTLLAAAPAIYDIFARVAHTPLHGLRWALSAGAPLSAATRDACRERFNIEICSLYGATETGGISIAVSGDEGVGVPMRGVEARLRPLDAQVYGREVGVLQIRSDSMMAGYLTPAGLDDAVFDDGWFETGDLARLDAAGAIHLLGRNSEFISSFGLKVDPADVEEVLLEHPQVAAAKVYAGRHENGFEAVFAAVVARAGFTDAEALRRHCANALSSYKCPTQITFLDDFPRTASGKIQRKLLPRAI